LCGAATCGSVRVGWTGDDGDIRTEAVLGEREISERVNEPVMGKLTSTRLNRYSLPEKPPTSRTASIFCSILCIWFSIRDITFHSFRVSVIIMKEKVGMIYLINDRIEDFPPEKVPWDGEFAVDESNGGVVRVFNVLKGDDLSLRKSSVAGEPRTKQVKWNMVAIMSEKA
jgi:hypothetical protein